MAAKRKAKAPENGLLTPTQKVRKTEILQEYQEIIESMY